ncbi:peptidoglycan-binding protein [Schnuerera sp.]|uniref:C40 family peptidase n=1 Tax=Schnuerera sp. TaxID=2794844 RepID=UPI002BC35F2C|nr:peptidoglycan-binding protein [Schnuerera sp.]HSH35698.1 peptidoglycan-binding protein [Schnuerera sp.]
MTNSDSLKKTIITFSIAGVLFANPVFVQADLGDQTLKQGMDHKDVQVLQEHLVNLNFLNLEETTTYYGEKTINAVKEFQYSQGLNPDGSFGSETFEALKKILDLKPLVYENLLKEGEEGKDIKALQERLKILGFLDIDECTTYFGSETRQAVKDFQKLYGIKVDGVAGYETIEAINEALKGNKRKVNPSASRGGSRDSSLGENIVATAKKYLGTPYRYGGNSTNGFDCSGFTQFVYKQIGINISRSSSTQAKDGKQVSRNDLQIGDLLIFTGTSGSNPGHTGIYIGDNKFIHASSGKQSQVIITDLNSGYYSRRFICGRRLF